MDLAGNGTVTVPCRLLKYTTRAELHSRAATLEDPDRNVSLFDYRRTSLHFHVSHLLSVTKEDADEVFPTS